MKVDIVPIKMNTILFVIMEQSFVTPKMDTSQGNWMNNGSLVLRMKKQDI